MGKQACQESVTYSETVYSKQDLSFQRSWLSLL